MPSTHDHALRPLLQHALERDVPLSEQLASLIWAYAEANDDVALLVGLARRHDIPGVLRDKLAAIPTAQVRAAWLTRPDVDLQQRRALLAGEKRASLLAILAADPSCDTGTLECLARHRSVSVPYALLANPAASLDVRRAAIMTLDSLGKPLDQSKQALAWRVIADDVDYHDAYARTLRSDLILALTTSTAHISAEGLSRLVDITVATTVDVLADLPRATGWWHSPLASRALQHILDLTLAPELDSASVARLEASLDTLSDHSSQQMERGIRLVAQRLARHRDGSLPDALRTAQSSDTAALAELVESETDLDVLRLVAMNPAADAATTVAAVKACGGYGVPEHRRHQPDVVLALFEASLCRYHFSPQAGDEDLIARIVESPRISNRDKRDIVARALYAGVLPASAAGLVPITDITRSGHPALLDGAVAALDAELAATPVNAELLLGVGATFDGSLRELVEVVAALTGGDDAADRDGPASGSAEHRVAG